MSAADVIRFSDLISALFGLAASIVLAIPALRAVTPKRYWERLGKLLRQNRDDPVTAKALEGVKSHVESAQLGDAASALKVNALGFSLLAVSFVFLLVAAIARASGKG